MNIDQLVKSSMTFYEEPEGFHVFNPNVRITTTYKGEQIDKEYLNKHPEITHLYPTHEKFQEFYHQVLKDVKPNRISWIYISENRMEVQYLSAP